MALPPSGLDGSPPAKPISHELGLQELENVRVKLASVDELSQKVTAESSNA